MKDCLSLEERGLNDFICRGVCLICVQRRSREKGWNICQGAERYGILVSFPKQNVAGSLRVLTTLMEDGQEFLIGLAPSMSLRP